MIVSILFCLGPPTSQICTKDCSRSHRRQGMCRPLRLDSTPFCHMSSYIPWTNVDESLLSTTVFPLSLNSLLLCLSFRRVYYLENLHGLSLSTVCVLTDPLSLPLPTKYCFFSVTLLFFTRHHCLLGFPGRCTTLGSS